MCNVIMFAFCYKILRLILRVHHFFLIMGACASKPWEIDLRDICQRLCCFFACCRGQIIVHMSEIDGSEPEFEIQDDKKDL